MRPFRPTFRLLHWLLHPFMMSGAIILFSLTSHASSALPTNPPSQPGDVKKKTYSADQVKSQEEAFQSASEAMKYLGTYIQNFKEFRDSKAREEARNAIAVCLSPNNGSCSDEQKLTVLKAAIQYNLGKEIRSMILQNNTNQENLKSLNKTSPLVDKDAHPEDRSTRAGFRVDENKIGSPTAIFLNSKNAMEQEVLGPAFMNEYRAFIDTYSKTTDRYSKDQNDKAHWHYVATKSSQNEGSKYVQQKDKTNPAQTEINKERFLHDQQTQNHPELQAQVEGIKRDLKPIPFVKQGNAMTPQNPDDWKTLKYNELGLAGSDNLEENKGIVKALNAAVDKTEQTLDKEHSPNRSPSNVGTTPTRTITGYELDIEKFDQFLDEIWPPSAAAKPQRTLIPKKKIP